MSEFGDYDVVADDRFEEDTDSPPKGVPFPNPELTQCPIVPLGFVGGRVVFAMPEGEIRSEPAANVGKLLRTDIFACAEGQTFLTYWRGQDDKFLRDLATIWFVRKCREAGKWDSSRPMRSLGLWLDGERIVLHLGDQIWRFDSPRKHEMLTVIAAIRERGSGPLYELRPPGPRPGKKGAPADDGAWVRQILDLWEFEDLGGGLTGADVVAGWLMAALLGAVAPFRGHLLLNALAGSGKTTLVQFVHGLLSALAGDIIDSFTEAGLRNDLAGKARPVLLDETEGQDGLAGPGPVERALEMFRRMATGNGGSRRQGDIGGGSVTQTAVGAVLMAAINPPKLLPADASRIVEIRMLPIRPEKGTTRAHLKAAIEKARGLGPALLTRAIKGSWRYREDVDELTAAMARSGLDPRTADLVSMLSAGRRLLLHDAPLTPEEADEEVQRWAPLLAQRAAADSVTNPGADAFAHLLAADSGLQLKSGRRETLGGMVRRAIRRDHLDTDILPNHGLRVTFDAAPDGRKGPWLLVANSSPKLEAIFRPTVWRDWRRALQNLDHLGPDYKTWSPPSSLRFGPGVKQRCLAIPLTPLFEVQIPAPNGRAERDERGSESASDIRAPRPVRSAAVPPSVPGEDIDWSD